MANEPKTMSDYKLVDYNLLFESLSKRFPVILGASIEIIEIFATSNTNEQRDRHF